MRKSGAVRERMGSEFVMIYCKNKRQDALDFGNEINARMPMVAVTACSPAALAPEVGSR